jgi:integrase
MVKRTGQMASITQRKNSFRVRIYRKDLPAITNTFHSKQEALKWARLIEVQLEQGTYIEESPKNLIKSDISFADAVEKYLETHAIHKANYRSESGILRLLSKRWCDRKLSSIAKQDVAHLKNDLYKLGRASSTINHYLNAISQLFKLASNEWGHIIPNPVEGISRALEPVGRMKRLLPSDEELLLHYCKQSCCKHLADIVTIATETGMRCGEILSMRWEDVDFSNRKVLLRKTKNGDSRQVPLSTRAKQTLESIYKPDESIIFPYQYWGLRRHFNAAVIKAKSAHKGVQNPFNDLRFHDLRHEALSRLSDKGLNVIELAHISGHRNLAMLRRYTHPNHETLLKKLDI